MAEVDFENLPTITSFAESSTPEGTVRLSGAMYLQLPEGVSTVSLSSKTSDLFAYLCTMQSASKRFWQTVIAQGETRVIPNVAVPKGAERYLNIRASSGTSHDVGVTIITYPLT